VPAVVAGYLLVAGLATGIQAAARVIVREHLYGTSLLVVSHACLARERPRDACPPKGFAVQRGLVRPDGLVASG
jgi:hypothetical protein